MNDIPRELLQNIASYNLNSVANNLTNRALDVSVDDLVQIAYREGLLTKESINDLIRKQRRAKQIEKDPRFPLVQQAFEKIVLACDYFVVQMSDIDQCIFEIRLHVPKANQAHDSNSQKYLDIATLLERVGIEIYVYITETDDTIVYSGVIGNGDRGQEAFERLKYVTNTINYLDIDVQETDDMAIYSSQRRYL